MKKQIEEVQNYFLNKITACEFELTSIDHQHSGWVRLSIIIDGYAFEFSINAKSKLAVFFSGFINLEIPDYRLRNIIALIESETERMKSENIERLREQLAKAEADL